VKILKSFTIGFVLLLGIASMGSTTARAESTLTPVTPFSAPDVINPKRGQFENLLKDLFPQNNLAQSAYPAWSGTQDRGTRYDWRQLQPVDPSTLPPSATDDDKYDFSQIDADIATSAAAGKRFHFRVAAFNSCCAVSYPANTNISVPDWLRGLGGATADHAYGGNTHVIPDWNNNTYLTNTEELIAALGRRYNKDERVEWFEFSGYGDFSENHVAFMRDQLALPGPDPGSSVATLGYYSQLEDQYITKASLIRLVDATLQAFPDTQVITAPGNPEIIKQLFRDSAELPSVVKPAGFRNDCLGTYDVVSWWASEFWSEYNQQNDPILPIMHNRWKTAPVATEWCNFLNGQTEQQYFDKALRDTINYHVSLIATTGHPYQYSGTSMPLGLFTQWSRTAKYSGYRYAMTAATVPDVVEYGGSVPMSVEWTNFGVAPTYDNWQVQYEVRDQSNAVVKTVNSSLALKNLFAEQNVTDLNADPASQATNDSLSIATTGLTAGNYAVFAKAVWNEHKSGGTNVVSFANMNLAQAGRSAGAYPVGSFQILAAGQTIPGAPNSGVEKSHSSVLLVGITTTIAVLSVFAIRRLGFAKQKVQFTKRP
jgi:hypothetical protein